MFTENSDLEGLTKALSDANSIHALHQLHQTIYSEQNSTSGEIGTSICDPKDNFLAFLASIVKTKQIRHLNNLLFQFQLLHPEYNVVKTPKPTSHDSELQELAALLVLSRLSHENGLHLLIKSSHERAVFNKISMI